MWRHWNTVVFDWFEIIRRFFFLIFFGKTFSWRSLSYLFDYLLPIPMRKIFFLNQLIISDVWMTEDHVGLKLVLALSIQSFLWECLVITDLNLKWDRMQVINQVNIFCFWFHCDFYSRLHLLKTMLISFISSPFRRIQNKVTTPKEQLELNGIEEKHTRVTLRKFFEPKRYPNYPVIPCKIIAIAYFIDHYQAI